MKKLTLCMITLSLIAGSVPAAELRGIWVDAFHPGFKTPEETSAMVAKADECNFNAIFVQVRKRGDVYYQSAIEPKAGDVSGGYDSLADIITKAHAAGLQVHAWISTLEVFHESFATSAMPEQVHIRHPEWLMKDYRGKTKLPGDRFLLDPGVPDARTYITGIVGEIARGYAVDGIHLDLVAYPGPEAGYNADSVALFNQETSRSGSPATDDEAWCNWRRARLTQLVQSAYQAAKTARPGIKVSAAVYSSADDARTRRFQDWVGWLNAGILDYAVAMVFPKDGEVFTQAATRCLSTSAERPVYIGQGGWKLRANAGADQVASARGLSAGGIVVYNYHYCSQARGGDQSSLMDTLKSGPFSQPATVPN